MSILSSDSLETLDYAVVREVRNGGNMKSKPMGNMQIIAVGYFFPLLPPIINLDFVD